MLALTLSAVASAQDAPDDPPGGPNTGPGDGPPADPGSGGGSQPTAGSQHQGVPAQAGSDNGPGNGPGPIPTATPTPDNGGMNGGSMMGPPAHELANRVVKHVATPVQLVIAGDGFHFFFIGADGSTVSGPVLPGLRRSSPKCTRPAVGSPSWTPSTR